MAKFDVWRLARSGAYVLECQSDLLRHLNSRLVVPLLPFGEAGKPVERLNPIFEIAGSSYVMAPQLAATVPVSELNLKITSLAEHDFTIGNALDMLISGF